MSYKRRHSSQLVNETILIVLNLQYVDMHYVDMHYVDMQYVDMQYVR